MIITCSTVCMRVSVEVCQLNMIDLRTSDEQGHSIYQLSLCSKSIYKILLVTKTNQKTGFVKLKVELKCARLLQIYMFDRQRSSNLLLGMVILLLIMKQFICIST